MHRDELHPRPQLTRDRWTDLCGLWQFAYDDGDTGLRDGWAEQPERFDRTIIVPFPPESRASGIGETAFHPVVWYRRAVTVAPEERDGRLLLHFGAVDYHAHVWVNGRLVATHEGGQTPFSADITAALRDGDAEQVIVVRAEDQPADLTQPRGKQDWEPEPHRIWYDRTTGIWQPVWLEPVPPLHIVEIRWTPDLDRGLLGVQVTLNCAPERPARLDLHLTLRGTTLAKHTFHVERSVARHAIGLDSGSTTMGQARVLWSPANPNLIDAELTLHDEAGQPDTVRSYLGLRSAAFANGRFLLNGRPYYLRLALEQGFWPESHLAAPNADALRREVELAKSLGFNGVRIHQKVEDPRFLYWCDRLGLLVWGEMANAYVFDAHAVERLTREWLDVVRRDYNHPCIVTWVPLNESWGVPSLPRDPSQLALRPLLVPPDARHRPDAPRDRQRRLGAPRHRCLGYPRLCAGRRDAARAVRHVGGGRADDHADAAAVPHHRPPRFAPCGRADHADRVRRHRLRARAWHTLVRLRHRHLDRGVPRQV